MWPRMGSATFPLRERGALTVRPARLLPAGLLQLSVPSCVWARGLPPSESPGRGSGRRGPGLDSGKLPGSSPGAAGLSLSLPPPSGRSLSLAPRRPEEAFPRPEGQRQVKPTGGARPRPPPSCFALSRAVEETQIAGLPSPALLKRQTLCAFPGRGSSRRSGRLGHG